MYPTQIVLRFLTQRGNWKIRRQFRLCGKLWVKCKVCWKTVLNFGYSCRLDIRAALQELLKCFLVAKAVTFVPIYYIQFSQSRVHPAPGVPILPASKIILFCLFKTNIFCNFMSLKDRVHAFLNLCNFKYKSRLQNSPVFPAKSETC